MSTPIAIASKAPDFDLPTNGGGRARIADYSGQYLVLYFYPKDDTSGCTVQATDFTAQAEQFTAAGAAILGISKDSVASHDKFVTKHSLGITLGSDETMETCQAYGIWVEKNMYGRKYMGIERSTFLIGPDGKLIQIWRKVRAAGHAEIVLDTIRSLSE